MISINQIKTILVPVDYSFEGRNGLLFAVSLAKKSNARLILLHVLPKQSIKYGSKGLDKSSDTELKKIFRSNSLGLRSMSIAIEDKYGVPVSSLVKIGRIAKTISNTAIIERADFIVMGSRGVGSKQDPSIGSIAHRVALESLVPVFIVPVKWKKRKIEKILVPIDTSKNTQRKVAPAIMVSKPLQSKLLLLGITNNEDTNALRIVRNRILDIQDKCSQHNIPSESKFISTEKMASTVLQFAYKTKSDAIAIMVDREKFLTKDVVVPSILQIVNYSDIPVLAVSVQFNK